MSTLTLRMQDSLAQQIRELAAQKQVSLSDFARSALESYAKQTQQELMLQEMITATKAMQDNPEIKAAVEGLSEEMAFTSTSTDYLHDGKEDWWR